ncbi:WXG100 family type VII secretion target [Mycobacterium sp. SMC-21]|uniref:WXG100 family type VII secretion target n=1 Tax=unclassified Mycobacterium TaxID=2642494 RepID=UPI0038762475
MIVGDLQVDPVIVHQGGGHVFDAIQHAAGCFIDHEAEVEDASEGWIGSSKQSLGEVAGVWQARHTEHLQALTQLSEALIEAAALYTGTDVDGAENITGIAGRMGL